MTFHKSGLEKAFYCIRWDFIHNTLTDIGLPNKMKNMIMDFMSSSSMQVLWNNKPSTPFLPKEASGKGIPSPCISLFCIWKESHKQ